MAIGFRFRVAVRARVRVLKTVFIILVLATLCLLLFSDVTIFVTPYSYVKLFAAELNLT